MPQRLLPSAMHQSGMTYLLLFSCYICSLPVFIEVQVEKSVVFHSFKVDNIFSL